MFAARASFFIAFAVLTGACRKDNSVDKTQKPASAAQTPSSAPSRFAATGWPEDAGPVVILPSSIPQEVRLVMPELTDQTLTDTSSFELDSLPNSRISLFSRTRKSTFATIAGGGSEDSPRGCKTWPSARLESYHGDAWSFGLAAGVAQELPMHGWGPPLAPDSNQAVRDVIRIASTAGNDSTFAGIQFAIRYLYRIELGASRAIIADAVRRINTEANVREEHVLVVAERARGSSENVVGFMETQMGREDDVRVPEIAGAVLLGENRRPGILVSLEYSEGSRLLLLERIATSRWVLRWRSAYAGC